MVLESIRSWKVYGHGFGVKYTVLDVNYMVLVLYGIILYRLGRNEYGPFQNYESVPGPYTFADSIVSAERPYTFRYKTVFFRRRYSFS